jgi:hypothetical protein
MFPPNAFFNVGMTGPVTTTGPIVPPGGGTIPMSTLTRPTGPRVRFGPEYRPGLVPTTIPPGFSPLQPSQTFLPMLPMTIPNVVGVGGLESFLPSIGNTLRALGAGAVLFPGVGPAIGIPARAFQKMGAYGTLGSILFGTAPAVFPTGPPTARPGSVLISPR